MKNLLIICAGAVLSAIFLTLASPGYNLWFTAYFALVPMLISISLTSKGFSTAWLFGSIYYIINLRWIITAVSDLGNAPHIVGVLATILAGCLLGLLWGLFGWISVKKRGANLLLAGFIVALEVAKSTMLTGFPMLNLSHTQYSFLPAIQMAEVTGAFGVTLIIAYMNLALVSLIVDRNKQSILLALVMLAASFAYGFSVQNREYAGNKLNIKVIQPAYAQADKWIPENKYDIMTEVNKMLRQNHGDADLLILPETVYPTFLNKTFAGYHMLEISGEKIPTIAGGIRFVEKDNKRTYYNSAFMFSDGNVSTYDKLHLVPFGEYFPLKSLFKPIDYYFFQGAEDFTPGYSPKIFTGKNFTAAPMICYESMYSELVRGQVMLGADIITVLTNDSWFGDTKGPYQHLATDVLRAVEFRKPVIRAAQSGVSACISPTGEITDTIGLGEKAIMNCEATTHKGLTLFATGGYGWLAAFLFVAWYFNRRKS